MPQFYLTPADMQTRQRVGSGDGTTPVEVYLGGVVDGFISGDFVDVVRTGSVQVTMYGTNGATLYAPVSSSLDAEGEYFRATFDAETETWDLDYHAGATAVAAPTVGLNEVAFGNASTGALTSTSNLTFIPNTGAYSLNPQNPIASSGNPGDVFIGGASTAGSYDGGRILLIGGRGDQSNDNTGGDIHLEGGGLLDQSLDVVSPLINVGGAALDGDGNNSSVRIASGYMADASNMSTIRPFAGQIKIGGGYTANADAFTGLDDPDFKDISIEAHWSDFVDPTVNAGITLKTGGAARLRVDAQGAFEVAGLIGTSGQVLTSAGPGAPPSWTTPATPPAQLTVVKPAPLTTVTVNASSDAGSSLHHNQHWRSSAAADITITVQPDSFFTGTDTYTSNNFNPSNPGPMPIGGSMIIGKHAAGNITFVAGAGVTINSPDSLIVNRLHGKVTLIKVAANTWDIEGNLASI